MGMTNASMNAQTRPAAQPDSAPIDGANDQPVALNPDVVVLQPDNTLASVKPADANWNHCDTPNDGRWPGKKA